MISKLYFKENEKIIENVLKNDKEWELVNANDRISGLTFNPENKTISVQPGKIATNGFFVALLRRINK